MPTYIYRNKVTGEEVEVIQSIAEQHVYSGKNGDEAGRWERVFTVPQMGVDVKIDPFDERAFVKQTSNKRETLGSIFDRSKEASIKREQKDGIDMKKEKFYENYSKRRKGAEHPEKKKERVRENLKKMGVSLE